MSEARAPCQNVGNFPVKLEFSVLHGKNIAIVKAFYAFILLVQQLQKGAACPNLGHAILQAQKKIIGEKGVPFLSRFFLFYIIMQSKYKVERLLFQYKL